MLRLVQDPATGRGRRCPGTKRIPVYKIAGKPLYRATPETRLNALPNPVPLQIEAITNRYGAGPQAFPGSWRVRIQRAAARRPMADAQDRPIWVNRMPVAGARWAKRCRVGLVQAKITNNGASKTAQYLFMAVIFLKPAKTARPVGLVNRSIHPLTKKIR